MMRMPGRRWPSVSILYAASCLFSAVVIFLQCADLAEFNADFAANSHAGALI